MIFPLSSRPATRSIHQSGFPGIRMMALVFTAIFSQLGPCLSAPLRVANVFGDRMVLQRDQKVPVWGWADPAAKITVTMAGQEKTATAGADGKWMIHLDPMDVSAESRELKIEAAGQKESVTFRDVLVGEVWLCSGQSNMEMGVHPSYAQVAPDDPLLRNVFIPHDRKDRPAADLPARASWSLCKPNALGGWSGTGYQAGLALRRELGVPVGLINSSVGGTGICMWISRRTFDEAPDYLEISRFLNSRDPLHPEGKAQIRKILATTRAITDENERAIETGGPFKDYPRILPLDPQRSGQCPTVSYNAHIHPLIPYAFRGVFWYQGEQDGPLGLRYLRLQTMLIESWRKDFGKKDLPFVIVQLPGRGDPPAESKPEGENFWSWMREAQMLAAAKIPHTHMTVTIDVGERDVHPKNKADVGKRMVRVALAKVYGRKVIPGGPVYKGHAIEGSRVRITFDQIGQGLMVATKQGEAPPVEDQAGNLRYFVIAGDDRKWHWADAVIDGKSVVVSSPDVPRPVAVRFAHFMYPEKFNFYNRDGYPAAPFRTDDWTDGQKTPDESISIWYQGPRDP